MTATRSIPPSSSPSSSPSTASPSAASVSPSSSPSAASVSAGDAAPIGSGVVDRLIRPLLRIDAAGSGLIGAALVAAPGWLASGLATTPASIRLLGALFVVNAWIVARPLRRPTRARFAVTGSVDVVFGIGVAGAIWLLAPDAAGWAPWALAGVALLSVDLGALKLLAARRHR